MEGRTARGHWRKRWKGEYTGRERDEDRELGSFSLLSLAEKRRGGGARLHAWDILWSPSLPPPLPFLSPLATTKVSGLRRRAPPARALGKDLCWQQERTPLLPFRPSSIFFPRSLSVELAPPFLGIMSDSIAPLRRGADRGKKEPLVCIAAFPCRAVEKALPRLWSPPFKPLHHLVMRKDLKDPPSLSSVPRLFWPFSHFGPLLSLAKETPALLRQKVAGKKNSPFQVLFWRGPPPPAAKGRGGA